MKETAIEVTDLTLRYQGAESRTLDGVSFQVAAGEVFGVLGPTGAGKSTLLKCVAGVIPHYEHDAAYRGSVTVLGEDVRGHRSLSGAVQDVGFVLQDPEAQILNPLVREELAWGMENRGVPIEEIHRRMGRAAELFGVGPLLDRFTHALSGGEKQRVVVAATYCLNPSVMLLDEPTSELDPAGTESVLSAVRTLSQQGVTVVVVEHKVEELVQYADRLLVLSGGTVLSSGSPREVLSHPDTPYRPQVVEVAARLRDRGLWPRGELPLTVDGAARQWEQQAHGADTAAGAA